MYLDTFDNPDQQQLYKVDLKKFGDSWLKALLTSLVLLVALKTDAKDLLMKVLTN